MRKAMPIPQPTCRKLLFTPSLFDFAVEHVRADHLFSISQLARILGVVTTTYLNLL
jgi:hypothetical protein